MEEKSEFKVNTNSLNLSQEMVFDVEYVGESLKEIPLGSYINKTVCGCGLTTVAIEGIHNTIILVPKVSLAENKAEQYPNKRYQGSLFVVKSGVDKDDVNRYYSSKRGQGIKIMCVYDSLWKCVDILDKCNIIVDESDQLVTCVGMKIDGKSNVTDKDVISYLFDTLSNHIERVSFISATPIPIDYMPEWVQGLKQITMSFVNTTKIVPIMVKDSNPVSVLRNKIIIPLRDNGIVEIADRNVTKVVVFINSVDGIIRTIKECRLKSEDVSIMCADSTRNDLKIRGYNRLVHNKLTKFNFITSSGFSGIDLYDEEVMTVIVSTTSKGHQMVNMLTDLKQAASRQRIKSNPNYDRFVFIYNQSAFTMSEEEVVSIINNTERRIINNCNRLNIDLDNNDKEMYDSTLTTFSQSEDFSRYSVYNNQRWNINSFAFNSERYKILELRKQFTKGFNVINVVSEFIELSYPKEYNTDGLSYEELLMKFEYYNSTEGDYEFSEDELATEALQTIFKFYELFGTTTQNYTYAKERIKAYNEGNEFKGLKLEIFRLFSVGNDYSRSEIKEKLNKLYSENSINRKAKHTDLYEFFSEVKEVKVLGERKVRIIKK